MIVAEEEGRSSLRIRIFTGKEPGEWALWRMKFKAILEGSEDLLGDLLSKRPSAGAGDAIVAASKKKDQRIFYQLVYTRMARLATYFSNLRRHALERMHGRRSSPSMNIRAGFALSSVDAGRRVT